MSNYEVQLLCVGWAFWWDFYTGGDRYTEWEPQGRQHFFLALLFFRA